MATLPVRASPANQRTLGNALCYAGDPVTTATPGVTATFAGAAGTGARSILGPAFTLRLAPRPHMTANEAGMCLTCKELRI